ncbi:bifunctional 4-hydroxy-2-oxoglutarate aldolase/2-dehydro-3-deoxy-phosphogluconate aldolase [Flammeovirga aprica]|uniref:Bifunctional 4-hydroxy-2-oxoglutarate aldolase/2-dehydro-3-deoxy-phosphogluconate aldolase n=1 Tax=Flammeovirga aprica JL-4 TaxID=694437 RepID=A0A7X9NZH1_9BACT|nr:bifunctional 4-hydroxy-2-oxoglutarate aldolase/2-dehydro-3-deoxy-phosphogluconate aldolase [Flammeovirga aprica]NME66774.1 bifunctional 4-hydroxy-2-oxoglutarate aldolase/2-dehydro-3-deoxy-phosphogluconate aldolase [Flammeovirga aprica JL-4]
MSKYTRIEVFNKMGETGMVPVFFHPNVEVAKQVLKATYEGGCRVFEFTNRGDGAQDIFKELLDYVRAELPDMMLGIGSIVEPYTALQYIQMGVDFIVSPLFNEEIIKACNRRKIAVSPGCGTISEIGKAEELGVELVKVFPAEQVGGPDFIKGVKAPCPWSNIMPTGGVTTEKENLEKWFKAGAHCVGIGSNLIVKDPSGAINVEGIRSLTEKVISDIKTFKTA